ncbi:MAG: hypothetical protein AAB402_03900 [Patescibacteria group bacterium]
MKKRIIRAAVTVAASFILFVIGMVIYSKVYLPPHKAKFIPTGKTITYSNHEVSVSCQRDTDCTLISNDWDYRKCGRPIFCNSAGSDARAVNVQAWQKLGGEQGFMTQDSCHELNVKKYGASYAVDAFEACMGGIIMRATCYFGKCLPVQVVP